MKRRGIASFLATSLFCFMAPRAAVLSAPATASPVIRSIAFEGNHAFTAEQLSTGLDRVRSGTAYEPGLVDLELQTRILSRYRKQGFIYATAQQRVSGDSNAVDLLVRIDEGAVYRYRSFRVEGGENLEISSFFSQLPGDLVNYEEIRRSSESVHRLLENQGFIDGEVIPEIVTDKASRTVAITVHISTGRPYLVGRVNFTNSASGAEHEILRKAWILEPGSLFSSSLLSISIVRVNELHLFQNVKQADCEVIKRPEPNLVDILVRLRPLVQ